MDSQGLLKSNLHDPRSDTDVLHINDAGYCILVRCLKTAVFGSKIGKHAGTGRNYSDVVIGPPPIHRYE